MKTIALILLALLPAFRLSAQQTAIPEVVLRDLDGNIISSSQITRNGTSTLVIFWKSTSSESCNNLENLWEAWEETLKQKGVKMVAVCVDCNGAWDYVKPLVNGNNWDFETYIDVNGDFKRAMSVGELPCTLLFGQDQNLICRYNSIYTGNKEFICESIMDNLNYGVTASNLKAAE